MAKAKTMSEVMDADVGAAVGETATDGATKNSGRRQLGPKVVYIQLAEGTDKAAVLSVHTNTRTLVDSMEQNPGSSYVKHILPMGEPRGKRTS